MLINVDVVIIGGGFAGCALAATLAREKVQTLVLEKTSEHIDRVRGEFLAPWGVVEARRLGLLDELLAGGANFTTVNIPYGEGIDPDVAHSQAMDMGQFVPEVPGPLCMQHITMANILNRVAVQAGAELLHGVQGVQITTGDEPEVRFVAEGREIKVRCRLLVGADGRGSRVAKQAGIRFQQDAPHHLLGGMLVEGATDWPANVQTVGTEGNVMFFYVFPQGEGRVRLYTCYARDDGRLMIPSHRSSSVRNKGAEPLRGPAALTRRPLDLN